MPKNETQAEQTDDPAAVTTEAPPEAVVVATPTSVSFRALADVNIGGVVVAGKGDYVGAMHCAPHITPDWLADALRYGRVEAESEPASAS